MERQAVGQELGPLLIELVDLALTAKQAHWNVSGMWFRQLHAQLDELADDVRLWSDDVAERLTTVGVTADARVETVAARTPFASFPSGSVDSLKVAPLIVDRLSKVVENNQTRIEKLGAVDLVSQELVISITGGLQKQEWMFAPGQHS